ncbi:hypothetical protein WJ438_38375 [Streptomyces sp. GD-15H]
MRSRRRRGRGRTCGHRGVYVWDNRSDTATPRNDRGRFVDDYSWGRHRGGRR